MNVQPYIHKYVNMNLEVSHNSPIPRYYQVVLAIREYIEKNRLVAGDPIPTEDVLAKRLSVSRGTIRHAVMLLVQEGILVKRPPRGTFVSNPPYVQRFLTTVEGVAQNMRSSGLRLEDKVLSFSEEKAGPYVLKQLAQNFPGEVGVLRRLRYLERSPAILITSYLPHKIYRKIQDIDFSRQSLFAMIQETCNLKPLAAERTFEPWSAKELVRDLLQVPQNAPLLFVKSLTYSDGEQPIEYYEAYIKKEFAKFTIRMTTSFGNTEKRH